MKYCVRCKEYWFDMDLNANEVCKRCRYKDYKRGLDEPLFFSVDNQLDFGPMAAQLPDLTPVEESLIARVHVHVNVMLVRGQQYKYSGHVVHFLREVGLVHHQLPLLPSQLIRSSCGLRTPPHTPSLAASLSGSSVFVGRLSPYGLTTFGAIIPAIAIS
ncbi:uncharacterized protein BCR38DRAFT_453089 [Pseudomassariella vexata]|uniref:DUF6570 domain-containing protein n=1 Tax=Pseudomassariella vexata TaxID=1141098 RepID=A0A1Y2D8N2_9PEZI|nr:uncharacterized protein BCR38DRAFT_453089 [Pseudomassariella vexata]ORY54985.1 hypothetical protein BCR38DRAFT_453089 [Pseudomassariella vexata]